MSNPLAIVVWDQLGNRTLHNWAIPEDLAVAYWSEQAEWSAREGGKAGNEPTPAIEFVNEVAHAHAPDAFDIICVLVRAAPTVDAVEFVGAGPLEDLLTDPRAGEQLFSRVEHAMAQDARLALALSKVWVGSSVENDYQRDRLLALGARDLSTGPAPGSAASE